jgi:hypothetical protein
MGPNLGGMMATKCNKQYRNKMLVVTRMRTSPERASVLADHGQIKPMAINSNVEAGLLLESILCGAKFSPLDESIS